ncbi:MAG: transporter substrate-binding domain-containing protein [Pseudomonadota bacterium]
MKSAAMSCMDLSRAAIACAAAILVGAWSQDATAQGLEPNVDPIACGGIYTIIRGDTLDQIARRAYQEDYRPGQFVQLFEANRATLPNPATLEVNQQILIPCLSGAGPRTLVEFKAQNPSFIFTPETLETAQGLGSASAAAVTPTQTTVAKVTLPTSDQIKFLTGSDFAPFTEEDLPEGGMITELVRRAMVAADNGQDYRISFINDWSSHLQVLLPDRAFDLGFPWYKPDCNRINLLSPAMQQRCTDFDFSEPFFEVPVGYYVKPGGRAITAQSYGDLTGMVICRPEGYFTFDLEQQGLVAPRITMITPRSPGECFEALVEEKADLVAINKLVAAEAIADQRIEAMVQELPELGTIQTLHVLTHKSNPLARNHIQLVNRGLQRLKQSGEWFEVVSRHLAEHGQRAQ